MDTAKINIQINFQQILEAVKQLSPTEKIQLNEMIWEQDIAIPVEHQQLVSERIKKARKNPETMLDWAEVSKTLVP